MPMKLPALTEDQVREIQRPVGEVMMVWSSKPPRWARLYTLRNPSDFPAYECWEMHPCTR